MMESFKLKVEKRNKLYFNKFKYKAVCNIQGAAYTYYTSNIETFVSRIEKLRDPNRQSLNSFGVRVMEENWKTYWEEVDIDKISQFITWRNVISKDRCMYRIQGNTVSFFSNDLSLLQTLDVIDVNISFYQVECLSPGTMYFKKQPKYKYRTYFKGKRMPKDFSDNVRSLHQMYQTIHFSEAIFLKLFHNNYHSFRYMHGSYFVEYNDDKMLTILAMWFPDMLAKTYILAKEP